MSRLVAVSLGVAVVRLRRRLELVARAEHELRGPLTAFALAAERACRSGDPGSLRGALDSELARAQVALADLGAARHGRRAAADSAEVVCLAELTRAAVAAWAPHARVEWEAGASRVCADRGRLAQALGNLLANAVEHGAGDIHVRAQRLGAGVRVELRNAAGAGRGRGLKIARAAARDAGGSLAVATLDLPLAA